MVATGFAQSWPGVANPCGPRRCMNKIINNEVAFAMLGLALAASCLSCSQTHPPTLMQVDTATSPPKGTVVVTTDREEYEGDAIVRQTYVPGDTIKIKVLNRLDRNIFCAETKQLDCTGARLERKQNGSWGNVPLSSFAALPGMTLQIKPGGSHEYFFTQNMIAAQMPQTGTFRIVILYITNKHKQAKTAQEALPDCAYSNEFRIAQRQTR
jgi:hypothetical protein